MNNSYAVTVSHAVSCPKSTSNMVWVDGNSVGLGCLGFSMNGVFAGNITTNMCKKANSKAHLEKQLRFMMSAKVQNYVASILGVSLDSYSWWIGAELKLIPTNQ